MCTIVKNRPGTSSPIYKPRRLFKLVSKHVNKAPAGVYFPLCHVGRVEYKWGRKTLDPQPHSISRLIEDGTRITGGFLHFCTTLHAARLLADGCGRSYSLMRVIEVKPLDTVYGGVLDDMDERYNRKMPQAICRSILVLKVHSASSPRKKGKANGKRKSAPSLS